MRFDTSGVPAEIASPSPKPGDIYPAKGGRSYEGSATRFWLVMSVRGNMVHCLGLSGSGDVITTTSYGVSVFERRDVIGRCEEIAAFSNSTLKIDWL